METENTEQLKSKSKLPIVILFAIGLVLVGGLIFTLSKNFKFQSTKPVIQEKPQLLIKLVKREGGTDIFLAPAEKGVEVSAFQFNATLPTETPGDKVTLEINKDLEKQAWSFPIAKIEGQGIKIAGFRLGNSPFVIADNFYVGSVNTTSFEINKADTVFYSSDALTKLPFSVQ